MPDNLKAHGKTIRCMDLENTHGLMVGNMRENMTWIRSTDMVFTFGLMGGNMKEDGLTENNMGKESIFFQMAPLKLEFGKMEEE